MDKNRQKLWQNFISGLLIAALGLLMEFYIIPAQIKVSAFGGSTGVNSRSFPQLAAWIILIPAILLAVTSGFQLLKMGKAEKQRNAPNRWRDELRAIGLIALFFLYAVLFNYVGYIVATIVVPPLVLLLLGSRNWKQYTAVYGVGIAVYILFKFVMQVPLP